MIEVRRRCGILSVVSNSDLENVKYGTFLIALYLCIYIIYVICIIGMFVKVQLSYYILFSSTIGSGCLSTIVLMIIRIYKSATLQITDITLNISKENIKNLLLLIDIEQSYYNYDYNIHLIRLFLSISLFILAMCQQENSTFAEFFFAIIDFIFNCIFSTISYFKYCERTMLKNTFSPLLKIVSTEQHKTKKYNLIRELYISTDTIDLPIICTICQLDFEETDIVTILLHCKHLYHNKCLHKWISSNTHHAVCKCPNCNEPIIVTNIQLVDNFLNDV